MSNERVITILNDLLEAEYGNLIHRLGECNPFVAWPAAHDQAVIRKMLADNKTHQSDIANLILVLRGSPVPPTYPTSVGGLHYLDLTYLMPMVISTLKGLVQAYEAVAGTGLRDADALITRILADHRTELVELQRLHANLGVVAAGR